MSVFLTTAEEAARGAGKLILAHLHDTHRVQNKSAFDFVTETDQLSEDFIRGYISERFPDHHFFCEEQVSALDADESTLIEAFDGYTWVVDALDGTTNYIRTIPQFAVSIGLAKDGEIIAGAIYDPMRDELFSAEKGAGAFLNGKPMHVSKVAEPEKCILGIGFPAADMEKRAETMRRLQNCGMHLGSLRLYNCAALLLSYVACGRLDASFEQGIHLWDMAAGTLLIKEAGGTVKDIDCSPFRLTSTGYCAANADLLKALEQYYN